MLIVLLLCLQTRVHVNIRTFQIQVFEIVDIVANSCPGSDRCFGDACGNAACGDLNCPAITAQVSLLWMLTWTLHAQQDLGIGVT